ncbi:MULTISPECIES: epoxide hydrolase family protein [unclassified Brevibacterium]|uniref:epoxide hydrolase family protein n=1 Tax=unclassified Brevibacterium TaxID=2614124 RepID=UPI001F0D255A|nr:epoxide hydrolase [Brevibacterium sp. S22]
MSNSHDSRPTTDVQPADIAQAADADMRGEAIRGFASHIPETELDDLRARLQSARLPEPETVARPSPDPRRWDQGVPLNDLTELVEYWRTVYSWRDFEDRLNDMGQFRTTVDGLGIHFLHRRSSRSNATPLILTHGWPGSIAEYIDVIDELAEPTDPDAPAFHCVVPSLPGFGFSDRPSATGWSTDRIAEAWVTLMGRLGYDRFAAFGGDWGGVITTILGGRFPEHLIGIHTTYAPGTPGASLEDLTADERAWALDAEDFWTHRAAYAHQQATRPQTIGYALVDSPVGQLAWILDKFAEWTDTADSPFETISRDRLLDNVSLYWLMSTGASSARIYFESHNSLDPDLRVDVPTAITMYPSDIEKYPRALSEHRYRSIVRWRAADRGGHFPSLETPDEFVADLRAGLSAILAANR